MISGIDLNPAFIIRFTFPSDKPSTFKEVKKAVIFFSVTEDLNATFPARAARQMNLTHTPLLCFHEIRVPDGLEKCIRILMHVNSDKSIEDIEHVYLEKAASLRPDISNK